MARDLDGIYYCPHISADGCDCRKAEYRMMQRAERELGLQTSGSFVVGDRYGDMEMAFRAGAHAYSCAAVTGLVSGRGTARNGLGSPDYIAEDLSGRRTGY